MKADTEFRIQPASEADVPALFELIQALAEYERLTHELKADEPRLRATLFGDPPRAEALIARAGDEPVGYAIYFHNYSSFLARPGLYLEDVFVRPEWRGRGLGQELLARVARVAVERGCARMEWAVLDWNEAATGFYRKLGARAMTDWHVYRLTGEALEELARSESG